MTDSHTETILVTGGLGYIGSHTVVSLCQFLQKKEKLTHFKKENLSINFQIAILDNLSNCSKCVLDRIKKIVETNQSKE